LTYLLDTNVVCEPTRRAPNAQVLAWLADRDDIEVAVSVATIAEIRYGIEGLPPGARKRALEAWFEAAFGPVRARILPVDFDVADLWGRLRRRVEREGRPMPLSDALIAATAERHRLTLVTRNTRDYAAWGGPVIDPWRAP
jgi:predicted nucleic acid-binding protein